MTYRITELDLQGVVDTLNKITGHPKDAWTKDDKGLYHSVIGCYVLSHAYGGVELQQICTDGGGVDTPLGSGHITKRELYGKMHAYMNGLFDAAKLVK